MNKSFKERLVTYKMLFNRIFQTYLTTVCLGYGLGGLYGLLKNNDFLNGAETGFILGIGWPVLAFQKAKELIFKE